MPIYEYVCEDCGRAFEKLATVAEQAVPACPTCGSPRTKKKVSGFISRSNASGIGDKTAPARSRFT